MIIWIASYPKSGNTYLRSFLSAYYFSKNGKFNFDLLLNIPQFPNMKFSKTKIDTKEEASKKWIYNQNIFFNKNKINFIKTHNCLSKYNGNEFTSKQETLGVIYIVRDPRNIITSLTNHYSISYDEALKYMLDDNSSLLEKSYDQDYSNFTYLNSWSNHYKSWKNNSKFKILFIKYEDLEDNRNEIFSKILIFINELSSKEQIIDDKKFSNSIRTTNFVNMKNKELNEGFEESIISKKTGKKINFFNLGFNNRWKKILPDDIKEKMNKEFKNDLNILNYN